MSNSDETRAMAMLQRMELNCLEMFEQFQLSHDVQRHLSDAYRAAACALDALRAENKGKVT